jgi:hypothetical protein
VVAELLNVAGLCPPHPLLARRANRRRNRGRSRSGPRSRSRPLAIASQEEVGRLVAFAEVLLRLPLQQVHGLEIFRRVVNLLL